MKERRISRETVVTKRHQYFTSDMLSIIEHYKTKKMATEGYRPSTTLAIQELLRIAYEHQGEY